MFEENIRYLGEEDAKKHLERLGYSGVEDSDIVESDTGLLWTIERGVSWRWTDLYPPPCILRMDNRTLMSYGEKNMQIWYRGRTAAYSLRHNTESGVVSVELSGVSPEKKSMRLSATRENIFVIDDVLEDMFPGGARTFKGRRRL